MPRDLALPDDDQAIKRRAASAEERRRKLARDAKRAALEEGQKPRVRRGDQSAREAAEWERLSKEADLEAKLDREHREMARQRQELRLGAQMEEEDRRHNQKHREASPKRERQTTGEGKPIVLPPPGLFTRNVSTIGGRGSTKAKLLRYWFDHAPAFA